MVVDLLIFSANDRTPGVRLGTGLLSIVARYAAFWRHDVNALERFQIQEPTWELLERERAAGHSDTALTASILTDTLSTVTVRWVTSAGVSLVIPDHQVGDALDRHLTEMVQVQHVAAPLRHEAPSEGVR